MKSRVRSILVLAAAAAVASVALPTRLAAATAPTSAPSATVDDNLNRMYDELEGASAYLKPRLPSEKDAEKCLAEITRSASKNLLKTRAIRALRAVRNDGYTEQPIQLGLVGDFNDFYTFLLDVEKRRQVTWIQEIKLKRILDHDGEIEGNVTLRLFFQPDENVGMLTRTEVAHPTTSPATDWVGMRQDEIRQRVQMLEYMQKRQIVVKHQADSLLALSKTTPRTQLLSELLNGIPAGVSMIDLSVDRTRITCTGLAPTDEKVAKFVNNLQKRQLLRDVKLVSTKDASPEQARAAAGARRTFEVEMSIDADLEQSRSASADAAGTATEGK
jgi:Tfp pilus assembly protein PilN